MGDPPGAGSRSTRAAGLVHASRLLLPADDRTGTVHVLGLAEAELPELPDADVVVLVAPPIPPGSLTPRAVAARTRLRRRAATSSGWIVAVHTVAASKLRSGPRDAARRRLSAGFVAELIRVRGRRVLDGVLEAAEARPAGDLSFSMRGAITSHTDRGVLRAGLPGTPADPARAAAGLEAAHGSGCPALIAARSQEPVSWSLEERLPGRAARRLTPQLVSDVAAFLARLPRSGRARTAALDELATIGRGFPDVAGGIEALCAHVVAASDAGAVLGHGDTWTGNLLVDDGRLTGVVDWDDWVEATVPGADMLYLLTAADRHAGKRSLGATLCARPWSDPALRDRSSAYWRATGHEPSAALLRAACIAWWSRRVVADLSRDPSLAVASGWAEQNVMSVVRAAESW